MFGLFRRKEPSGFSYSSTAEDVTHGIDGTGLTAVVTGASAGIGAETARVLALRGVHVILGVRNTSTGEKVKETIIKEASSSKIDVMELDLGSKASIRKFASEFNSLGLPLNILINNAGIMGTPFTLSQDGIELQFATNHIGHFLLTNLLLENMKNATHKSNIEGRIVNVSSDSHAWSYRGGIRFDKINDKSGYNSIIAYGQSKLANILHANELSRRLMEEEVAITANSVHPGVIVTNILRHQSFLNGIVANLGKFIFRLKNVQQGAATTCYVALHPQVRGVSGKFFINSKEATPSSQARDLDLAKKLWDFSLSLVHDS